MKMDQALTQLESIKLHQKIKQVERCQKHAICRRRTETENEKEKT